TSKFNIYREGTSPITIDDMRFHPRYSQVTASWELLLTKLTGRVPRSPAPWYVGSTWSEGLVELTALPPLSASTVGLLGSPHGQGPLLAASALFPGRTKFPPPQWDIFWLHLRR